MSAITDAAEAALEAAIAGPHSTSVDGLTVVAQPIPDLIAAAEYLADKAAARSRSSSFGIRIRKLRAPGAVDRNGPLG